MSSAKAKARTVQESYVVGPKADRLIATTRYEKPTVIAFPLSGLGLAGQISMVGNGGETIEPTLPPPV